MKHRRTRFQVTVNRAGVAVEFLDENFFDNTILDDKGTTSLDFNIAQLVQEVRAALYFVGTEGTKH